MTTKVLVLTQPNCDLCDHAKATLERVAADFSLEIRTLGLGSEEGAALASTIGLAFPPGVLLDGDAFSHGRLSERRLRKELRRRAALAAPAAADKSVASGADPETPEPELTRAERKAERRRLKEVRRERRRQSMAR
ncbi:MAG: hypothetical protein ACRDY6_15220, partial [Acidimicrobiia bacterium]